MTHPPPECFALINDWADSFGPVLGEAIALSTESAVVLGLVCGAIGYVCAEGLHRGVERLVEWRLSRRYRDE